MHGVDDALKLDDEAIAGAFDHAALMPGDGRVEMIASQRSEASQDALFVSGGQPGVSDYVGRQNRSELARFAHCVLSALLNGTRLVHEPKFEEPPTTANMAGAGDFLKRIGGYIATTLEM